MFEEHYKCVGEGWRPILEALGEQIANTLRGMEDTSSKVLQVKEKFGGLRVYLRPVGVSQTCKDAIWNATFFAERMSFKMCEVCGSIKGVETRPRQGIKMSRTLTLCAEHHKVRDETGSLPELGV